MGRRVALRGTQHPLHAVAGVLGRSLPVPVNFVAFSWAELHYLGFFQAWGVVGLAPLVGACGPWAARHWRRDADFGIHLTNNIALIAGALVCVPV